MSNQPTAMSDPAQVTAARQQNDAFRRSLTGGTLLLSGGMIALGAANQARIIAAVRAFDDFDQSDPGDTHDIGDLDVEIEEPGIARWHELIFFRIDRINNAPALTIMLASEW